MKYFIFGLALFLFACSPSPKFQVGDCVQDKNLYCEFQCSEIAKVRKVLRVGQKYYEYMVVVPYYMRDVVVELDFETFEHAKEKVECPLE